MKKVLLATTALVAFAGAATADVNLSGTARFGLNYTDAPGFATDGVSLLPSTTLEKRVSLNIDMSTETDSGLELGGRIRIRSNETAFGQQKDELGVPIVEADNAVTGGGTDVNGAVLYVKTGGFKLSVGNVCGALECMPGVYAGTVGLNGAGFHNVSLNTKDAKYWGWTAYDASGLGANGAQVEYAVGDFSAMLSHSAMNDAVASNDVMGIHLAYSFGDWTVAAGMQDGDDVTGAGDKTVLTVGGKLGDFGVGLAYADNNGTDKVTLNGSYSMGATTLSMFVADDGSVAATDTPWGIGASYDLGGASLVAGYSSGPTGDGTASAGIKFKF